jgi:hypothetical protein
LIALARFRSNIILKHAAGASAGRCVFNTAPFVIGAQYTLRFYSEGRPLPNPSAVITIGSYADACGVCGGNNATCAGCDGVPNSGKKIDSCGVCGGSCDDPFMISIVNPRTDFQRSLLYVIRAWESDGFPLTLFSCVAAALLNCNGRHHLPTEQPQVCVRVDPCLSVLCDLGVAGILAWIVVSIPLVPFRQLQFSAPLPSSGTRGQLSIQSPTLRADWLQFAASATGTTFDVAVYLLSQQPLQRMSAVVTMSLNDSVAIDACGVCGGNNSSCSGCDGVPHRQVDRNIRPLLRAAV